MTAMYATGSNSANNVCIKPPALIAFLSQELLCKWKRYFAHCTNSEWRQKVKKPL